MNAKKSQLETYLPYAVGDGTEGTLRICRAPGMTGLFVPDPIALKHFGGFSKWGEVIGESRIATRRLDDITEIDTIDFLKIDVQGSVLAVFRNGRDKLARTVAVQTEVSFLPLYVGQPVFGDVELELRNLGFVPHAFAAVKNSLIAPMTNPANPYSSRNQLLEADIVYVRDFMRPDLMRPEQLKHLALIAHHCYQSYDLAINCVHHLATRGAIAEDAQTRYLGLMQSGR